MVKMNYEKVYYSIINHALRKTLSGQRWKGDGNYYEIHHIVPRCLKGNNSNKNLVLLTAREHFICHWLLFKRYANDTIIRAKMLKAWFMMAVNSKTNKREFISSRWYEKYRKEMALAMHNAQSGIKNSNYGKQWFTNRNTGISKAFITAPDETWVLGRNLFHGETSKIKFKIKVKIKKSYYKKPLIFKSQLNILKSKLHTYNLWNKYHSGNYTGLIDFAKENKITKQQLSRLFRKYISYYKENISIGVHSFKSDKKLICNYFYK